MCVHVEGERETQGDTPLMSSAWKVSPVSDSGFENPPPHFTCSHDEKFNLNSSVVVFRSCVYAEGGGREGDDKFVCSFVCVCVCVCVFVWCVYVCAAVCVWRCVCV
jgi:hypothetical protein